MGAGSVVTKEELRITHTDITDYTDFFSAINC